MFREDYGRFASLADLFRLIGYDERVNKLESLARLDFSRFQYRKPRYISPPDRSMLTSL